MKRTLLPFLILAIIALNHVRAETETIDLKVLAEKARPAVLLLVVSDAAGKEIATGTGFLISSDGKLITNHHVIEHAASAVAKAENGGLFPVEGVLADDPKNDLVLLKLKAKDLPFLQLGNSDRIEVGTRIAVIGSPLGLEGTLSEGIVSAARELLGEIKLLQITAAISPGSSGSPVMNTKGDVIGIASALLRGGQALNFAVPVECGVRLMARVKPSSVPQPLDRGVHAGRNGWRGFPVDEVVLSPSNTVRIGWPLPVATLDVKGGKEDDGFYSDSDWGAIIRAGENDDGVEMLKHAKALVVRYPDNATAWYGLGCAFDSQHFTNDTIAAYRQAIKIKPDCAKAWYNLGVTYAESRRDNEAASAFEEARKMMPEWFK